MQPAEQLMRTSALAVKQNWPTLPLVEDPSRKGPMLAGLVLLLLLLCVSVCWIWRDRSLRCAPRAYIGAQLCNFLHRCLAMLKAYRNAPEAGGPTKGSGARAGCNGQVEVARSVAQETRGHMSFKERARAMDHLESTFIVVLIFHEDARFVKCCSCVGTRILDMLR